MSLVGTRPILPDELEQYVIIGENGTGKTHLMKALYSAYS